MSRSHNCILPAILLYRVIRKVSRLSQAPDVIMHVLLKLTLAADYCLFAVMVALL